MITLSIFLIALILAKDIGISHSLVQDGMNVCSKKSLVKVVDVYPTTWFEDWDCEASYPTITCDRIRSNETEIKSVYFVKEDLICCPGWLKSEDDKEECSQSCPNGYFGANCMFECRCLNGRNPNQCNPEDGSCDCLDGWTGRECDESCDPGYYGPNCSSKSTFTCMNRGANHPVTGQCLCQSEYDGSNCETECEIIEDTNCGLIVCENCILNSSSSCDVTGNACICRNGWRGRYCIDPCEIGSTGHFCGDRCCSGRGYCTNESCICTDGYHGDECQYSCEDGTFGRYCKQTCECPSCNHVTGDCERCPSGFTGSRCTDRCPPTRWGESCNMTCSCETGEPCDVFTGECIHSSGSKSQSLLWLPLVLVVVLLMFAGGACLCYVCNRSSKKVQNEQTVDRNDNFSDINDTGTWSDGYQEVRNNINPNLPNRYEDNIYNPAYQSFDANTDMGKGIYNSVIPSAKDRHEAHSSVTSLFTNPVYNIDVPESKQKVTAPSKPVEAAEYHQYEDLSHDYDNAIFKK